MLRYLTLDIIYSSKLTIIRQGYNPLQKSLAHLYQIARKYVDKVFRGVRTEVSKSFINVSMYLVFATNWGHKIKII